MQMWIVNEEEETVRTEKKTPQQHSKDNLDSNERKVGASKCKVTTLLRAQRGAWTERYGTVNQTERNGGRLATATPTCDKTA